MLNFHFVFFGIVGHAKHRLHRCCNWSVTDEEQCIMYFPSFAQAADAFVRRRVYTRARVNERSSLTTLGDARIRIGARVQTQLFHVRAHSVINNVRTAN